MMEMLRKYIRYALNEKPFNPDLVASLIHLRRASGLDDSQIPEILNEISRRIVKEKGIDKTTYSCLFDVVFFICSWRIWILQVLL